MWPRYDLLPRIKLKISRSRNTFSQNSPIKSSNFEKFLYCTGSYCHTLYQCVVNPKTRTYDFFPCHQRYVDMSVCVTVHMYVCLYFCMCDYICIYVCMCVCMCDCTYVDMSVCVVCVDLLVLWGRCSPIQHLTLRSQLPQHVEMLYLTHLQFYLNITYILLQFFMKCLSIKIAVYVLVLHYGLPPQGSGIKCQWPLSLLPSALYLTLSQEWKGIASWQLAAWRKPMTRVTCDPFTGRKVKGNKVTLMALMAPPGE